MLTFYTLNYNALYLRLLALNTIIPITSATAAVLKKPPAVFTYYWMDGSAGKLL